MGSNLLPRYLLRQNILSSVQRSYRNLVLPVSCLYVRGGGAGISTSHTHTGHNFKLGLLVSLMF